MLCTYPAVIHQDPDGLWLEFIDFHCSTHADNLQELLLFAKEAMECHILGLLECGEKLPVPSAFFDKPNTTLVQSDIDLAQHTKSVKKNCTIPAWLNRQALAKNLNFSKILQEALIANL
ncbi:MAG: type II toxin-antitoxin system HicB family antitoxin [Schwartzia sp. (in: firmicutes)]